MDRQIFKCTFDRAQYLHGEQVCIELPHGSRLRGTAIFRLAEAIRADIRQNGNRVIIIGLAEGGYGVEITAESGEIWEGAFDIVRDHREVTRYGFLTDFSSDDTGEEDVEWIRDLHLNAVQFYDWMFRHDQFLPPTQKYEDPLGRHMDIRVITGKIAACQKHGIRAMAYGAVYAATPQTFLQHPEWGMYTLDGEPMKFADWLYYMDISKDSGWVSHLLKEYRSAICLGFSGIHMDTYGFPKRVWNRWGNKMELAEQFPALIDAAALAVRTEDENAGVIFNAVNNWPVESVAGSGQDAVYIEVWPPHDTYFDLYMLVRRARELSGKNVVLAAYMKAFQGGDEIAAQRSFRLAWAVICASGGTQLALGKHRGILKDSYYVNYAKLAESFLPTVQKYCDFLVRYSDLLYNDKGVDTGKTAAGGINEDICFESDACLFSAEGKGDSIWPIIRETDQRIGIHLINLTGNDNRWNEAKQEPRRIRGIRIHFRLDRRIKGIYCASPDEASLRAKELSWTYRQSSQGRIYMAEIPEIFYWTVVWVQWEG